MAKNWSQIMSNELGGLAQGNNAGFKANGCVDFIHHWDVPNDRKFTYANFVWEYWSLISDPYIIHLLVEEEKLDCALDAGSPTDYMLETKLLVNSVISDAKEGARLIICDPKDLFLCYIMGTL